MDARAPAFPAPRFPTRNHRPPIRHLHRITVPIQSWRIQALAVPNRDPAKMINGSQIDS